MPSILKHIPNPKVLFRPESINNSKANKCFTPNYYLLSKQLTKEQDNLLKFIIVSVSNTNYIRINNDLILRYKRLNSIIPNTLHSKNARLKTSRKQIVKDIIFLIELRVIIRIKPNSAHFIVNPCYAYGKSDLQCGKLSVDYINKWQELANAGEIHEKEAERFGLSYWKSVREKKFQLMDITKYTGNRLKMWKAKKYSIKSLKWDNDLYDYSVKYFGHLRDWMEFANSRPLMLNTIQ